MLVRMTVPCCDFNDERFSGGAEGGGYIARGATGRWCVVMYAGPKKVERHVAAGGEVITIEEAYARIADMGPNEWADF